MERHWPQSPPVFLSFLSLSLLYSPPLSPHPFSQQLNIFLLYSTARQVIYHCPSASALKALNKRLSWGTKFNIWALSSETQKLVDTMKWWDNKWEYYNRCEVAQAEYVPCKIPVSIENISKRLLLVCLWNCSQKKKNKKRLLQSPLGVHPNGLEKQVSIHPSQQPLHTDRIPVLKPSTWQLINNWLTCFSGEPDDLHQAPHWLHSQHEGQQRQRQRETTWLWNHKQQLHSCISPSGSLSPDSRWSVHCVFSCQTAATSDMPC